ncbi:hypothetical protein HPG69_010031 [Diceros bicornis minor]|uniref:Lipid-binding serum glycoprotein N-terminal domain-containing protein n=1 Tax=Diceros bicornis minor TaxID=77932 RepID=A0A7J7EQ92_DICBM|nr:hypothetical protein HPG69_010031 [Diceros bicornis minor]
MSTQKMFQLWKLVLLCCLITGTSVSLLGNLGNDVDNVVNNLEKGAETVDNTLEGESTRALQESKAWQLAKQKFQEAENLVDNAASKILPIVNGSLVENQSHQIQDLKAELTPDGKSVNLTIPVTAGVSLALRVADLKASLDLLTSVRIETDAQTRHSTVVLGECTNDPASISLTQLNGHCEQITKTVNTLNSFLSKTKSFLVQKEVCPLIHIFLHNLDVNSFQNLSSKSRPGEGGPFPLLPSEGRLAALLLPHTSWSGTLGTQKDPSVVLSKLGECGSPAADPHLKRADEEHRYAVHLLVRGQALHPTLRRDGAPPQGPVVKPGQSLDPLVFLAAD